VDLYAAVDTLLALDTLLLLRVRPLKRNIKFDYKVKRVQLKLLSLPQTKFLIYAAWEKTSHPMYVFVSAVAHISSQIR
jgi:hypothetical protein